MESLLENARRLSFARTKKKLPDYHRHLYDVLILQQSRIIGIYGARGVGKTTLMLQLMQAKSFPASDVLYISCDHPMFKGVSLFDFIVYFSQMGGKLIVIDEIHEATGFEQALKSVYDFLDIAIIFSGSSAVQLTNPDFSRRYAMYALPQLSFREYLALRLDINLPRYTLASLLNNHIDVAYDIQSKLLDHKILPLYRDYCEHGGYPFYFESPDSFLQKLNDTISLTISLDLGRLFNIQHDKIDMLKKLLSVLCRAKPFEVSIEKLAASVELSKPTLYHYLDYLQRGELLRLVPNELKKHKQIRRPDKLYLYHPNLFSALCLTHEVGTIREAFFASQLGPNHQIAYSNEGDFLVDETLTFEVGGASKDFSQALNKADNAYVAADNIEVGSGSKIPLWLFGFTY